MTSHIDEKDMTSHLENRTDQLDGGSKEVDHTVTVSYSPEEEKALLKRLDWILLPLMGLGTALQLIDKSALGTAATLGLQQDLALQGSQYSWAVTIYYFGLLLGTYPANLLMQRYHSGRVVAVAFFLWGSVMLGTAGVHNFAALSAVRFLLGLFEAAMAPGFTMITARFYTQHEQPLRFALWTLANFIGPCLFFLVFYGVGQLPREPLEQWRWIFVLLGVLTLFAGGLMWFFLPDKPDNWRWFSERQREICARRVAASRAGVKDVHFRWYQVKEAIFDVKAWLVCVLIICQQAGVSLYTNFLGLVIKGFGYSGLKAMLLQMPGWALAGIGSIIMGVATARLVSVQRAKCLILAGIACVTVTSGAVLYTHPPSSRGDNQVTAIVTLVIIGLNMVGYAMILSLVGQNFTGTTKKQTVLSMVFFTYCVSNIAVPQSFIPAEAPRYSTGILTVLLMQAVYIVANVLIWAIARMENRRRDRAMSSDEVYSEAGVMLDRTDKENKAFRYCF